MRQKQELNPPREKHVHHEQTSLETYWRSRLSWGSRSTISGVIITIAWFSFLSFQTWTSCFTSHLILDKKQKET